MLTLEQFVNAMRGEGLRESTIKVYKSVVGGFLEWAKKNNKGVDVDSAEEYVRERATELSPAGLHFYKMGLRTYFRLSGIEIPRGKLKALRVNNVREDKFITLAELDTIIRACNNLRDKVIFRLLFHTGVRARELLNIRVGDLDLRNKRVFIRGLKNSKRVRSVRFIRPELVIPLIKGYLRQRGIDPDNPAHKDEYLIVSNRGRRMSYSRLREIVRKYGKAIGKEDISPHWFRHGFVVWNKIHNVPAEVTALQIGDTIRTTQEIYSHFSQVDVDRVYDQLEGVVEPARREEKDVVEYVEELQVKNEILSEKLQELERELHTLKLVKELIEHADELNRILPLIRKSNNK